MYNPEPKVFLVGETKIVDEGLADYMNYVGAPDWESDAPSDSEKIMEVMGRLCYRSFAPGLNPNVTKVREGNEKYLGHVADVGHGSIFEHATVNFVFADVSRVFTHELVRHRAGTAISQESLRFVRLTDLGFWIPTVIAENTEATQIFLETVRHLEDLQLKLADIFGLDNEEKPVSFGLKKIISSAMRRIAPIGLSTTIGWSCNLRALRHVIAMRTDPAAEEEIRLVFGRVADICKERYPNAFADFEEVEIDGLIWHKPVNHKI
jgi:thymidylate synthase (FAD)